MTLHYKHQAKCQPKLNLLFIRSRLTFPNPTLESAWPRYFVLIISFLTTRARGGTLHCTASQPHIPRSIIFLRTTHYTHYSHRPRIVQATTLYINIQLRNNSFISQLLYILRSQPLHNEDLTTSRLNALSRRQQHTSKPHIHPPSTNPKPNTTRSNTPAAQMPNTSPNNNTGPIPTANPSLTPNSPSPTSTKTA